MTLFVYEATRTLELLAGVGLSFAFEELGDDPAGDPGVDAELRQLCDGVVAGRVRERVVHSGGRISMIEGVVETPRGARRSTHVFGRAARDAQEQTHDYAPYCRSR